MKVKDHHRKRKRIGQRITCGIESSGSQMIWSVDLLHSKFIKGLKEVLLMWVPHLYRYSIKDKITKVRKFKNINNRCMACYHIRTIAVFSKAEAFGAYIFPNL